MSTDIMLKAVWTSSFELKNGTPVTMFTGNIHSISFLHIFMSAKWT